MREGGGAGPVVPGSITEEPAPGPQIHREYLSTVVLPIASLFNPVAECVARLMLDASRVAIRGSSHWVTRLRVLC